MEIWSSQDICFTHVVIWNTVQSIIYMQFWPSIVHGSSVRRFSKNKSLLYSSNNLGIKSMTTAVNPCRARPETIREARNIIVHTDASALRRRRTIRSYKRCLMCNVAHFPYSLLELIQMSSVFFSNYKQHVKGCADPRQILWQWNAVEDTDVPMTKVIVTPAAAKAFQGHKQWSDSVYCICSLRCNRSTPVWTW